MDGFVWTTVCCWQADYVEGFHAFVSNPMLRRAAQRLAYKLQEVGAIDIEIEVAPEEIIKTYPGARSPFRVSYKAPQEIQP